MDEALDNIKLLKELRKEYQQMRIGTDVEQQMPKWKVMVDKCKERGIDSGLILMDEDAFNMLTETVLIQLITNNKQ
jgi:hypothetical protein